MFDNKEKNTSSSPESYSENIFEELSWELDFGKDAPVAESKKRQPQDYMKMAITGLSILNVVLVLFFVLSFLYVKVQNNPTYTAKSILDPFCFLILWDLQDRNTSGSCSSLASLKNTYNAQTEELKNTLSAKIESIFLDLYVIENFWSSQEVSFLMKNKVDKMKVIDILNDFDKLKNDYTAWDKKQVECAGIKIMNDSTLTMSCEVYSSSWDRVDMSNRLWIIGDTGDRKNSLVEGTSISAAASFINFIEKNPVYNFQLLEKQKIFDSEMVGEWPYVRKTKVELKMKYNNLKNNLSL